jgi:flagellar basal-body rod modification protein FlgD
MPEIGRPQTAQEKQFANIAMTPKVADETDIGDKLNKITGRKDAMAGVKFVDRKLHNAMGKDGFMKLLAAELANQDPSSPVDQKKFTSELAQFSQLEQLANMNTKLENMGGNKALEQKYYGASFLGKMAYTKGTSLEVKNDGDPSDLPFFLPKDAKNVIVRVYDGKNQMMAQIEKEGLSAGSHTLQWDGKNLDLTPATKGDYRIEVSAFDEGYQAFQGETKSSGLVTSVDFENGEAVLTLDGKKKVYFRDVETFKLPDNNISQTTPRAKVTEAYTK